MSVRIDGASIVADPDVMARISQQGPQGLVPWIEEPRPRQVGQPVLQEYRMRLKGTAWLLDVPERQNIAVSGCYVKLLEIVTRFLNLLLRI